MPAFRASVWCPDERRNFTITLARHLDITYLTKIKSNLRDITNIYIHIIRTNVCYALDWLVNESYI